MRILSKTNNLIIMQHISNIKITNQVFTVDICELQVRIANLTSYTYVLAVIQKNKKIDRLSLLTSNRL